MLQGGAAAPPGSYRLRVSATSDSGQNVAATALSPARVVGVAQDATGVRLELSGRPSVAPAAVKAIL
jgi:flagellar hook assembly protein FlgD